MDNRFINIKSIGKEDFELSMRLATNGRKTVGYTIKDNRFILYWAISSTSKIQLLPYEMETVEITQLVLGWLSRAKPTASQPDHDGDNGIGFHIFNDAWGQVDGEWEAYASIEPIWAMYGK